ncbi:MAG: DUF4838 domain-containing protein [Lentisphaerae bacterium]|nr:DUF4838 domain-containing protein [Lentisphaerota bacterium]
MKSPRLPLCLLLFYAACLLHAQTLCQFKDADIIIPEAAPGIVRLAAEELQKHLSKLTGGEFPIGKGGKHEFSLVLGNAPQNQALDFDLDSLPRDGFFILATEKSIHIVGRDKPATQKANLFHLLYDCQDRATLLGAYEFLEQQGIRWPAPGEINTYFPNKTMLACPIGLQRHQPVFTDRMGCEYYNFMQKYRDSAEYVKSNDEALLWGLRLKLSGRTSAIGCHTEQFLKLWEVWKDHPERFQLMKNGERNFKYLCWTDPAVEEIWYRCADAFFSGKKPEAAGLPHLASWRGQNSRREFFIDPMDHGSQNDGRCRCQRCDEFRRKHPCPDDTELVWKVIASVAERIRDKHPGKLIATLVYPPKHHFPTTVKLPDNIAVRLCLPGAKTAALPQRLKGELQRIKEWSDILGKDQVPLWTYQCEIHGRKLPGPPEVYPGLFASYLQHIRPLAAGVFNEIHALSHTYRNMDMYIQARLMWNPDRDLNTELKEYFEVYYGTQAGPLLQVLFQRFEENWIRYWRRVTPDTSEMEKVGLALDGQVLKKIVWSEIYTTAEMQHIDDTLKQAEVLSAGNSEHLRRVRMLRPWMFDIMKEERNEVMHLRDLCPDIDVFSCPWEQTKAIPLVNASRLTQGSLQPSTCQIRVDNGQLQIRVKANEPTPDKTLSDPKRPSGDHSLWRDNVLEFFFFADDTLTQVMVNDLGAWTCRRVHSKQVIWEPLPGTEVKMEKTGNGFLCELSVPRTSFPGDPLLFNVTRSRRVKDSLEENSTLSPGSKLGNWHNPESFARLLFKP